jgi:hypothetical protein
MTVTYFIDLRADSVGGNPVAGADDVVVRTEAQQNPNPSTPLAPQLVQSIQGRDVLLGTHGFHVNRGDGIGNLSHWAKWVQPGPNGFFVGVLWPGDSRWIPFLDYPVEGSEAIKSGQLLAAYLGANFGGASSLSFASHSLGARMVLETIRRLPSSFRVKALMLMAAAIDDDCLTHEYRDAAARVGKISVLASQYDEVLKWAFSWRSVLACRARPHRTHSSKPAGKPVADADSPKLLGVRTRKLHQLRRGTCRFGRGRAGSSACGRSAGGITKTLDRGELATSLGGRFRFNTPDLAKRLRSGLGVRGRFRAPVLGYGLVYEAFAYAHPPSASN